MEVLNMRKSIIFCESNNGTSKKVSEIFPLILGASKACDIKNASIDITGFDNAVFVFEFCGHDTAKETREYIRINKDKLLGKRIAVIGIFISETDFDRYAEKVLSELGRMADFKGFIKEELKANKHACELAGKCAEVLKRPSVELNKRELLQATHEFIMGHNTCTLASGFDEFVRCTPIEYMYIDGAFYFITEGGLKFIGILQNPKVCIAIFNSYTDMQSLASLQVTGEAEIIPLFCDEYNKVMEKKGLNINNLKNMPVNLNMLKVSVEKFEFLNSAFKKKGADANQILLMKQ